ncbi:unnamed protein product [Effrenium voratum]|nr:unnamed protein product [Effrenium voratum]
MPVCPVCFEDAESVEYATMHNHSWKNHACDGHGLCWRCLAQHVEIQLLEGRYNVRCPGAAGCSYRLVSLDVGRALDVLEREDGKEEVVGTLRLRYEQLRSDCHQHRLRELLKKSQGANEAWLLTRVQPCPRCLTLVRKETGCSHVFCRCGSDFCFPCGAPPGGCICSQMRRPGGSKVVFAAWLRSADESRVEWLWDYRGLVDDNDDDGDEEVEQERLLTTLQFYLWLASAPVPSPLKPLPEPAVPASTAPPALVEKLPEIRWKKSERKVVAEAEEPGGLDVSRWWTTTSPSPTRKKRTPWRSITPVCRRGRGAPMPRSARAGRWIATAQGLCAGARRRSGKRMGIVCAPLRLFTDAGSVHTMLGKRGRGRSAARRYAGCESFANGSWTWHSRLSKANRLHPF